MALLSRLPVPDAITPQRWAILAATAARLLQDHGAELHAAGWDALDLFGLHAAAPAANPSGMGLAWLLGAHGDVLDVSPDAVGMRRQPDGARLAFRPRSTMARAGMASAWVLARGRDPPAPAGEASITEGGHSATPDNAQPSGPSETITPPASHLPPTIGT